jgi:lycopene beta-cyclase
MSGVFSFLMPVEELTPTFINMKFDYIIAGAGCAGLSLLFRILNEPKLNNKKICVIDQDSKTDNDRTWCYWEKENGIFDHLTFHNWRTLTFKTEDFKKQYDLAEYTYKMIRGIDFYNYVIPSAKKFKNVTIIQDELIKIKVEDGLALAIGKNKSYRGEYIFNSTPLFNPEMNKKNTLLQHFLGWRIKVNNPEFDPKIGTLMDFSPEQKHGTTFMYFLPTDPNTALVEYTLFTDSILEKEAYRSELKKYLKEHVPSQEYSIEEEEFGVIPMTQAKFKTHVEGKIIHLGTAGGYTKASSGYTFQFIQNHTKKIIQQLVDGKSPVVRKSLRDKMFHWYDLTLLEVMLSKAMSGKEIFSMIFKKAPSNSIMRFLANESSWIEDIRIMRTVPMKTFLPAGIKKLLS